MKSLVKLFKDESGATAVEYGLIVALISVAIVGIITILGQTLGDTYEKVEGSLAAANG